MSVSESATAQSSADLEWQAEIDRIAALWAAYEAETDGDRSAKRCEEHLAAVDHLLIERQAPSLRALEQKLALIAQTYEDSVIEAALIDALQRDVRHLLASSGEA